MENKIVHTHGDSQNKLIVHKVNIAHYRLIQLSDLADQEKPFYDWIERFAETLFNTDKSLDYILKNKSLSEITTLITNVMNDTSESRPTLYDGIGRPYPYKKAIYYFFAWLIRDAPQQRLAPLVTRMRELDDKNLSTNDFRVDALANLIVKYRGTVKTFEWRNIRDILISRLEGSRRSLKGHKIETIVRSAVASALQTYYKTHFNYGLYKVNLAKKQIKIDNDTIDVSIRLTDKLSSQITHIYIPVKSRETEGGGHAHLFSRDIITAIRNIKDKDPLARFVVVIIAENWDKKELKKISNDIDIIFHFDMSPNDFHSFDESSQVLLNKYIKELLDGKNTNL
ncbi:hypothetical protein [Limosilactobacillus reuteri]|uniref:hypothetical protein n=1 Tax=Limosilactobacillus reuteri TaxID=1598 RepID=UPI00161EE906|nr:hypothetical protein [Limosilactobacillus reuteri]